MKYTTITDQAKSDAVKARISQLESEHYQLSLEQKIAEASLPASAEDVLDLEARLMTLESAISSLQHGE
jgi:hypothetical protein